MNDYSYRNSLEEWCNGIEITWNSVRGLIEDSVAESELQRWQHQLSSLKNDLELGNSKADPELYEKAQNLYEDLNEFIIAVESAKDRNQEDRNPAVPIGGHRLPPLSYPYNALEPVIAEEIMRLHHSKHHQSYVDGLNKAEKEMRKARESGDFSLIKHWQREAAFHGSGHYLHTIFWSIMSPDGGGMPTGQLSRAINETFGSFDKFKKHFSEAAKNVEASGWAILVWSPRSQRLEILQAEKHQNLTQWDVIPLLALDVWEHAYYLQYKNDRGKYVDNWWNIVNWKEVGERFNKARTIKWDPY
jgi:superoxide dismutase, Fe-Mn family